MRICDTMGQNINIIVSYPYLYVLIKTFVSSYKAEYQAE